MAISTAILIFDDVQIIDYTGPFEALGRRGPTYLVAERPGALVTNMGMQVVPNYTFGNEPKPDVLVIPGGGSSGEPGTRRYGVGAQLDNQAVIDWIRATAKTAACVLSVCNGAFLAQRAGLLDGLTATTTAGYIDYLAAVAPKTTVVRDERVIDNGTIVVTGGLSAGIDGALRVIQKLEGFAVAVETALHMEYDWRPDDGWSRAALADMHVPQSLYPAFHTSAARLVSFENGRERLREVWSVRSDVTSAELIRRIDATWDDSDWTRLPGGGASTVATERASDGTRWRATVGVEPGPPDAVGSAAEPGTRQQVTIEVIRLGSDS
jgi:putative intracellular protease/amidase